MISNAYIFWTTKANQNLIRFSKSWKIILLNDLMVFFCYLHSLTPKIEVKVGRYFKKSNFLTVTLRDRAAVAWKISLWYFRGCYPLVRQTFQKSFLTYGPLQVGQKYEKIDKKSQFWQKLTSFSLCFIILAIARALKRPEISSKINIWHYHPGCSIQIVPQVGWEYWISQNFVIISKNW